MNEKRFFTKINKNGRNVIIDKECHTELFDMTLACEVLNRLDLKLKTYNEQLGEQQATIEQLQEENKELKHWKKRMIEYLSDWFNKTEYLTVLYKINEINNEIGLDSDE